MRTHVEYWSGPVPGYGAATPNGVFAILKPSNHIETTGGYIELPGGEDVGFIDVVVREHGLYVVGAGQSSDQVWLWDGHWTAIARPAYGTNAVMFNPARDEVWATTDGRSATKWNLSSNIARVEFYDAGSQGFGYAEPDGFMVRGADCYIDLARGLCGFTDFGDVAIGYGVDDIAVVRFASDGILRKLAGGVSRHIRAKRQGDDFAITVVDYAAHTTTVYWATLAELRALPAATAPVPPVVPPVIPPKPEPNPVSIPNQLAVVERVRAAFPTPLGARHAEFLITLARAIGLNAGLLKKSGGTTITLPDGVTVSQDIICFPDGEGHDVLGDGEGAAVPQWGEGGPGDPARWYSVSGVVVPPGEPPATSNALVDTTRLQAIILTLQTATLDLGKRLKTLEDRPQDRPILGGKVALRTDNGHYITAENGGGGDVVADRTDIGGWEEFTIVPR